MLCHCLTGCAASRNLWAGLVVLPAWLALSGCRQQADKPADKPTSAEPTVVIGTVIPAAPPQPAAPERPGAPAVSPGPPAAQPKAIRPAEVPSLAETTRNVATSPRRPVTSVRREFASPQQAAYAVLSPDDRLLAVSQGNGQIEFFDVATGEQRAIVRAHRSGAQLAFSPDGTRLASGSFTDGQVKLWNVAEKTELANLGHASSAVSELIFSDDGNTLIAAGMALYAPQTPGTVQIWEVKTRALRRTLAPHGGAVWSVAAPRRGEWIATCGVAGEVEGGNLGEVKIWSRDGEKLLHTLSNPLGPVARIALSPDDRILAVAEMGGPRYAQRSGWIRLIDTETWQTIASLVGHADLAQRIAFSPDGKRLASEENHSSIFIWDVGSRHRIGSWSFFAVGGATLMFSADSRALLCHVNQPTIVDVDTLLQNPSQLDDPKTQVQGQSLAPAWEQPSFSAVNALRFSTDGDRLAAGYSYGTVCIYETKSGTVDKLWPAGNSGLIAREFASDLRLAASADRFVAIWDIETRNVRSRVPASPQGTFATALSPDGELLATCHPDSTIKVWHMPTGKLWAQAVQLDALPTCLTFSPDSKLLASATRADPRGPVVTWQLPAVRPSSNDSRAALEGAETASVPAPVAQSAAGSSPSANPKTPIDSEMQSKLKNARALVRQQRADSDEFQEILQSMATRLPAMPVAAGGGADGWERLTLNTSGLGFDCFRITSPLDAPADLCLAFIEPKGKMNWFVLPVTGRMRAADNFERQDNLDLAGVAEGRNVIFQVLAHGTIRPRGEYLLWFSTEGTEPVELNLLWNLVPFDATRVGAISNAVAKAVGLKTPLSFRQPPAESLTRLSVLPHGAPVASVAFSSSGMLATAGYDNQVRLWERTGGQLKQTISGALAVFSPDGQTIATAGAVDDPTTVVLWDVASGQQRHVLKRGHLRLVEHLAFSPDGAQLASGCRGGIVTLWDTRTGGQSWQPEFVVSPAADQGRPLSSRRAGVRSAASSPVND